MKLIIICLIMSSCSPNPVDDFPETIYPETPTMKSAYDAMETK